MQGVGGEGIVCRFERGSADQLLVKLELVAEVFGHGLQNVYRQIGHFGADAVARENCEIQNHFVIEDLKISEAKATLYAVGRKDATGLLGREKEKKTNRKGAKKSAQRTESGTTSCVF